MWRNAVDRCPEAGEVTVFPRREPWVQIRQRAPVLLGLRRTRPEPLIAGDGIDEIDPALSGIECEHTAWALAIRQIEVLGMRPERVSPVPTSWHRHRSARTDEHNLVAQFAGRDERAPTTVELRGNRPD